jgi:hypothetical protein
MIRLTFLQLTKLRPDAWLLLYVKWSDFGTVPFVATCAPSTDLELQISIPLETSSRPREGEGIYGLLLLRVNGSRI